jgi:outer membrane protein assembly factor BamA
MRLSALLLALVGASAMAQLAFQAPSSTYDGQKVSTVSLIANPHRDLQGLYPLVTQHAGEPYSQKKIDADWEALQKAGHFPEVKVSVVP